MAGEEQRTRVLYQAIADFSQLSKAARKAKQELKELRDEENKGNAQSAAGSEKSASARDKNTRAARAQTKEEKSAAAATRENADAATRVASAFRERIAATDRYVNSARGATQATRESNRETERGSRSSHDAANANRVQSGSVDTLTRSLTSAIAQMDRLRAAQDSGGSRRQRQEHDRTAGSVQRVTGQVEKLNKSLIKVGNWRPRLMPPFIALVPIIGALLALINPLIAGIGAVGVAGFAMASSLGSIAGAALGAIPALATLLSLAGALKLAFGGIGNVFKAFSATKKASAGGGGGKANKEELSQAEELQRAWEKYRRSIENVQYAQEDLDEARKGYTQRINDLRKAVDRAAMSEARAAANAQLSRENYANVLADPGSTKGDKMSAAVDVDEAKAEVVDVQEENRKNAADLQKMQQDGMEGDRQVVMAKRALTDAIWAERDAMLDLRNVQNGSNKATSASAGAANELADALAKLSPSARKVVLSILAMDAQWTALKKNVQEEFFSPVVDEVARLTEIFPALESMLTDTAGAAGRVAEKLLQMVLSDRWKKDMILLGKQNVPIIENLGDALINILNILQDLTFAAGPFLTELTEGLSAGTASFAEMVSTARDTGSLAAWLDVVLDRMRQWWQIIKNIGVSIFNYGAAAGDFGQWLTDGFEKITEGWLKNSEEARKAGSPFQEYLENIKPMLSEIGGLLGDFFGWFAKTTMDPENIKMFTEIVALIRDDLGPAMSEFLDTLAKSGVGKDLVGALVSIFEALDTFLDKGGSEGISAFWNTVSDLFALFQSILENTPEPIIKGLAIAFGTLAALRFFGLTSLLGLILKVAKSASVGRLLTRLGAPGLARALGGGAAAAAGAGGAAAAGGAALAAGAGARASGTVLRGFTGNAGAHAAAGAGGRASGFLGRLGTRAAQGSKGGLVATAASIGVGTLSDEVIKDGNKGVRDTSGSILSSAATGAGVGGLIGSVVPVVGTGLGAAVGGALGAGSAALGMDSEQWAKTGEEISSSWNDVIVPFWQNVGTNIATWWDENVVQWFRDVGTNISTWWNESVVTPFKSAATSVSAWWFENVVTPFNAVVGAIQRGWDQLVVQPFMTTANNIAAWWNEQVVTRWNSVADSISTWWNTSVVTRWNSVADTISTWWSTSVVARWNSVADTISTWWSTSVVARWNSVADSVSSWWSTSVVPRWNAVADSVSTAWNDIVVTPFNGLVTTISTAWDTWVIAPFKTVIAGIQSTWDATIGKIGNIKIPDISNSITGWADSLFRHNGGPILKRNSGGGVPGSGNSDTVSAMLTPGEFVLRKAVVERIGMDNLTSLNAGVLDYATLLKNMNADKGSNLSSPMSSPQFLNRGGPVSPVPYNSGGAVLPVSQQTTNNRGFVVENLTMVNPVAEPTSDSLPRAVRSLAYLGM